MKLHLPKRLFTALLAAISFIAPAAYTVTVGGAAALIAYQPVSAAVSKTDTTITVTGLRYQVDGGVSNQNAALTAEAVNAATLSGSGAEIVVGSGAQLFLQTWAATIANNGSISLVNDITLQAGAGRDSRGGVRFGNDGSDYTTTLSGVITLEANAMMHAGGTNAINISGAVMGDYSLDVRGHGYSFTGPVTVSDLILQGDGNTKTVDGYKGIMIFTGDVTADTLDVKTNIMVTMGSNAAGDTPASKVSLGNITNAGTLTLNGDVTLDSAIKGAGTVTVTGALTLTDYNNLYNLSVTYANSATSGFRTGFTGSLTEGGTLTFAAGATLAISNLGTGDSYSLGDNGTVTGTLVGSTIYDVNENMTYAAATHASATHVYVNSGTLTIGNTSNAAGTKSGVPASQNFVLNGGSIKWTAQATTIARIEVIADSDFTIFDMQAVADSQSTGNYLTLSSVDIAAGKTLTINKAGNASWKQWLNIAALTGEGTLAVNGPGSSDWGESNPAYHLITLSDFKGNISVTSREGVKSADKDVYHATVNTGESGVNMGTLTIAGFGQNNEQSTFTFNVQGDSSLQSMALTDAATVNVSENKGLTVSSVTGTGTLTKTGSGSMTADINGLHGTLKIEDGLFNLSKAVDEGTTVYGTMVVGDGAILDIKGYAAHNNLTLKEGATLKNTSATDPGSDKRQLPSITLEGNAEVSATGTIRMIGTGYSATTLNLGEYTLTKTGAGEFNMLNTTIQGSGTIQINEGKVVAGVGNGKSQDLTNLSLNIQSSGKFELSGSSQSITNLTMAGGTLTASGLTLTVAGNSSFGSGSSTVNGSITFGGSMEIVEGATVGFGGAVTIAEGAAATFGGGANIGSTVSNNGTLALNGTLNVTSTSGLTQIGEESTTYQGGQVEGNGYTTTTYQLVGGSGNISYGDSFAVTLNGSATRVHATSKGENTLTFDMASGSTFHVMTGEETVSQNTLSFITAYHVAEGSTLELADAIANHNGYSTTITGAGTLHIKIGRNTQNNGSHGNVLKSASGFTGVVEIESTGTDGAGNTQLDQYVLGNGASFRLISGNHWSNGAPTEISRDIELAGKTEDSFTFRHENAVRLSGVVTGTYLTAGQKYNSTSSNNMFLSGAGSKIQHVTMKNNGAAAGKLTVEAAMSFGTLFANEVVLDNSATLTIGYTDTNDQIISGDSSINGSFTLNANTGLNITAGTMNVNGAVTNSGSITVSGGSADFTNTLGMSAGSSLSVSGGLATVSGALNVTGENVSLSQSDTGVLNLNGSVSIAQNAGLTLSGNVGIADTIVNDGALVFNDSLYLLGDVLQYEQKAAGQTSYTRDGNQGFIHEVGAQYWLTQSSSDDLAAGASVSFGERFEKNGNGNYIVHYGESEEFELTEDGNRYYFSTTSATGATFYVSSTGLEVFADEASRAAAFVLSDGSSMTLAAGAATNAGATITASGNNTINLATGSTLNAFTKEGSSTITLTGSGTYVAGKSSAVNVTTTSLQASTNWTGTVLFTGNVSESTGFDNSFGNVNSTIEMKGAHGWLSNGLNMDSILKLTREGEGVNDPNGFTVTAASNWQHTFSNKVWGNGDFTVANTGDGNPDYFFTGDLSEWSGAFKVSNPTSTEIIVKMTGGGDLFAENAGGIVVTEDAAGTVSATLGSTDSAVKTTMRGSVINNSESAALNLTVQGNTDFQKNVTVTSMTVNSGKTATMNATLKAGSVTNSGELKLADKATITGGTMSNVQMSSAGIDTTATDGSKGSINNALVQLAKDATFTIQDMTLTNTTVTAADVTNVKFENVSVKGVTVLNMQAAVGTGGSDMSFETDSYSGITLVNTGDGTGSSIVLNLGDLSCLTPMGPGKYDLTITLSGFTMSNDSSGILFAGDSWLGELLTAQGAKQYVASGDVAAPANVGGGAGGSTVGVSFQSDGSVGTIITITGLNVPEPTTATLSLLALAALAARRRRKA